MNTYKIEMQKNKKLKNKLILAYNILSTCIKVEDVTLTSLANKINQVTKKMDELKSNNIIKEIFNNEK